MSINLKTLTLNTAQLEDMVSFFRAVGVELKQQTVNKGGAVFKGQISGTELNLMSIPRRENKTSPDLAFQLEVHSLTKCESELKKISRVQFIMEITELPHGKMMVVLDPDGHSIEIVEKTSVS